MLWSEWMDALWRTGSRMGHARRDEERASGQDNSVCTGPGRTRERRMPSDSGFSVGGGSGRWGRGWARSPGVPGAVLGELVMYPKGDRDMPKILN